MSSPDSHRVDSTDLFTDGAYGRAREAGTEPTPTRRRCQPRTSRTNIACGACQKRRTKCSGGPSPCNKCSHSGRDCHFDPRLDTRRKGSFKASDTHEIRQYVWDGILQFLRLGEQDQINEFLQLLRQYASADATAEFLLYHIKPIESEMATMPQRVDKNAIISLVLRGLDSSSVSIKSGTPAVNANARHGDTFQASLTLPSSRSDESFPANHQWFFPRDNLHFQSKGPMSSDLRDGPAPPSSATHCAMSWYSSHGERDCWSQWVAPSSQCHQNNTYVDTDDRQGGLLGQGVDHRLRDVGHPTASDVRPVGPKPAPGSVFHRSGSRLDAHISLQRGLHYPLTSFPVSWPRNCANASMPSPAVPQWHADKRDFTAPDQSGQMISCFQQYPSCMTSFPMPAGSTDTH